MQIGRRLIWVFLVAIIGIVSLLFQVGALEVSRDLKIEEWSRALGISEELLMSFCHRTARRGPARGRHHPGDRTTHP